MNCLSRLKKTQKLRKICNSSLFELKGNEAKEEINGNFSKLSFFLIFLIIASGNESRRKKTNQLFLVRDITILMIQVQTSREAINMFC